MLTHFGKVKHSDNTSILSVIKNKLTLNWKERDLLATKIAPSPLHMTSVLTAFNFGVHIPYTHPCHGTVFLTP